MCADLGACKRNELHWSHLLNSSQSWSSTYDCSLCVFQVVDCLDLGRATLAKIRQNLGWALAYNAFGIPLAAGALLPGYGLALSPSVAAGMMAFSSVAVVGNSLLLRGNEGAAGMAPSAPAADERALAQTA